MVLGFKEIFKEPILSGTKIHTIREDKSNRWQNGKTIHMATGIRTKNYSQFHIAQCISIQNIMIKWYSHFGDWRGDTLTFIDGIAVTGDIVESIAKNDGFMNPEDFFRWFHSDFYGKIIHWSKKKY